MDPQKWWMNNQGTSRRIFAIASVISIILAVILLHSDIKEFLSAHPWWTDLLDVVHAERSCFIDSVVRHGSLRRLGNHQHPAGNLSIKSQGAETIWDRRWARRDYAMGRSQSSGSHTDVQERMQRVTR